jgi:hypothetical protein
MRMGAVVIAVLGVGCSSSGSDDKVASSAKPKVVDLADVGLRFDLPAGADAVGNGDTATLTQASCTVTLRKLAADAPTETLDQIFARMKARPGFVEKTSHALTVKGPTVEWTEKDDQGNLVYALERRYLYGESAEYQVQGSCTNKDDILPIRLTLRDKITPLP